MTLPLLALVVLTAIAKLCVLPGPSDKPGAITPPATGTPPPAPPASPGPNTCTLRVHFYDVAQGLAALVDLPDGRHVLVDTGDGAHRAGCGASCATAHEHLMARLGRDLGGRPLDMLWITHQHGDHLGGVIDVAGSTHLHTYVDNGRDADKAEVSTARAAAARAGARLVVVDPGHREGPIASTAAVRLTPIVPAAWPPACAHDANDCSIGLRVDACRTSVVFTGDAEISEEPSLDLGGPVGLLQVGHHGSDTSTGDALLARAPPRYAVISSGHEGEGTNRTYCHPRVVTVARLTKVLGGAGSKTIRSFDGTVACRDAGEASHWKDVPASDRLWVTARDGDVVLSSKGDGKFTRE